MALPYCVKTLFPQSGDTSKYTLLPISRNNNNPRNQSFDSENLERSLEKTRPTSTRRALFKVDPRIVSDATIGLSDGLTVPFALTAGISALGDTRLVIYAGLAELIAGGISMGLGGYLGAVSEAQAYGATLSETRKTIAEDAASTRELIISTFDGHGFSDDLLDSMVAQLASSRTNTESFLMRFHHGLSESSCSSSRAYISALTIALGYFLGGLTPLMPYFIFETNQMAFHWSIAVMAVALFTFGYVKTVMVGEGKLFACLKGGVQMMVLGGVAAAAAMGCVKAVGS